jgi:hypothetical protein
VLRARAAAFDSEWSLRRPRGRAGGTWYGTRSTDKGSSYRQLSTAQSPPRLPPGLPLDSPAGTPPGPRRRAAAADSGGYRYEGGQWAGGTAVRTAGGTAGTEPSQSSSLNGCADSTAAEVPKADHGARADAPPPDGPTCANAAHGAGLCRPLRATRTCQRPRHVHRQTGSCARSSARSRACSRAAKPCDPPRRCGCAGALRCDQLQHRAAARTSAAAQEERREA